MANVRLIKVKKTCSFASIHEIYKWARNERYKDAYDWNLSNIALFVEGVEEFLRSIRFHKTSHVTSEPGMEEEGAKAAIEWLTEHEYIEIVDCQNPEYISETTFFTYV